MQFKTKVAMSTKFPRRSLGCTTRNFPLSTTSAVSASFKYPTIPSQFSISKMVASSANSDHTLFPFIDITMIFTCYNSFKSFFSISSIWSFPQSKHGSSKASSTLEKPQYKEDCVVVICRKDVENVMGNLGIVCSRESEELNEYSFGSDEVSGLFEEEPSLVELKEAFDVFDVNKDGFIDAQELQRVVCVLGLKEGLKIENCNKMISKFDVNRDGRIDFREFVKLMEKAFIF